MSLSFELSLDRAKSSLKVQDASIGRAPGNASWSQVVAKVFKQVFNL